MTSPASATFERSAAKEGSDSTGAEFSSDDDDSEAAGVVLASLAGDGAIDRGRRGAGLGPIGTAVRSSLPKASAGEATVSA
jgi:hypothetical protein